MCDYKPYQNGVKGVLHGTWRLKLMTPLVIRNGSKSACQTQPKIIQKGRNQAIEYTWAEAQKKLKKDATGKSDWSEVADFNYHFFLHKNRVEVDYSVPASSIRGALRQWSIKNLIDRNDWKTFYIPKKEEWTKEKIIELVERANAALKDKNNRWFAILSLFGSAYELDVEIANPISWSGRLRIQTELPHIADAKLYAQGNWKAKPGIIEGPNNINRHITVRNPLDRVSHAAKEGGLHQFIEMSEGEKFMVHFQILNPTKIDAEMIQLWTQDINAGFLRFGALASQGRGRVEIEYQNYQFFFNPKYQIDSNLLIGKSDLAKGSLLVNFWQGYQLNEQELQTLFSTIQL